MAKCHRIFIVWLIAQGMIDNKTNIKDTPKDKKNVFSALELAFQLGYLIAVPLVVFAIGGRLLDKKLETSPFLFITGIILSMGVSSFLVYKKTAKIMSDIDTQQQPGDKQQENKSNL